MNTAAPIPASTFTITSVQHFEPADDDDGTVPLLAYAGDSDRTAREHITGSYDADHGEDRQERVDAERWLSDYLIAEGPRAESAVPNAKPSRLASRTRCCVESAASLVSSSVRGYASKVGVVVPDPAVQNGDGEPACRAPSTVTNSPRAPQAEITVSAQVNTDLPCSAQGYIGAHQGSPAEIAKNPPVAFDDGNARPKGTTGARRTDRGYARHDSSRAANTRKGPQRRVRRPPHPA
jgi:hypothetical protein